VKRRYDADVTRDGAAAMGFAGRLKKRVPLPVRRRLRVVWRIVGRANDLVTSRGRMVPWKNYALSIGGGDFEKVGNEYLGHFKELAGLRPHHRVLDVGCGIGRMAVPLTSYLTEGEYQGFDTVRESIRWCRRRIGTRYPNFHFQHVDIYNRHYNPKGKAKAAEARFPYPDDHFDFAFLVSVITHMLPADMENYVAETARVLKPGARCLVTSTLLNDESLDLIEQGKSSLDFRYEFDGFRSVERDEPETSVAYPESYLRQVLSSHSLEIDEPIHYGSWTGRTGPSFQDIVIATKSPGATPLR